MSTHAAETTPVGFGFTKPQTIALLISIFVLGFAAGAQWQRRQPVTIRIERVKLGTCVGLEAITSEVTLIHSEKQKATSGAGKPVWTWLLITPSHKGACGD